MDQCKHCCFRGNIAACKNAECGHHENWYAVEQRKLIDELSVRIDGAGSTILDLEACLRHINKVSYGALRQPSIQLSEK